MQATEEALCRDLVYSFCSALNEWERIYSIIQRISDGKFVSRKDRDLVAEITREVHLQTHASLFAQHVIPREREFGASPGQPKSWSPQGSFFDVSRATISEVVFRDEAHAEVITNWGYMLPDELTMFVVRRSNGRWLIDGLKTRSEGAWKVAHL
jgi:hypothetical protein